VRKRPDAGEQALFESRWAAKLAHDPYYSPALNDQLQRIYEPR
jgi:hypothetical protein